MMIKICKGCKGEFKAKNNKWRYCNPECKSIIRIIQKKEANIRLRERKPDYWVNWAKSENGIRSRRKYLKSESKKRLNKKWKESEKGKKYQDEYSENWNRKRRLQIIDKLGGKCIRCGFSDWRALQVDHINGGGSKERKGFKTIQYLDIILKNEDNKYQLLCANCNWIKRYEENECKIK